jgi:Ca2+-binding EF-hand superfamily protein
LRQALVSAGYNFSDADISKFVASVDLNFDGKLSFNGILYYFVERLLNVEITFFLLKEFSNIFNRAKTYRVTSPTATTNIDSDVYKLFKQYDRDNSGYLTVNELKQALAKAGYIFTDSEIARFVSSVDVNYDGKLSLGGLSFMFYNYILFLKS